MWDISNLENHDLFEVKFSRSQPSELNAMKFFSDSIDVKPFTLE